MCNILCYMQHRIGNGWLMIKSFRHKGLAELFETGASRGVRRDLIKRALRRLDALHRAGQLQDLLKILLFLWSQSQTGI